MTGPTYNGQPIDPNLREVMQACLDDLTNNYRCIDCESDAIKVFVVFRTAKEATNQERQQVLMNFILSHYNEKTGQYEPSDNLYPLCYIHALDQGVYNLMIGDDILSK